MNEWLECKLGDIPDVQTGPFSSQLKMNNTLLAILLLLQ